jgi:hypothetical protein
MVVFSPLFATPARHIYVMAAVAFFTVSCALLPSSFAARTAGPNPRFALPFEAFARTRVAFDCHGAES